ncbi:MAG: response regulator transcription factor [Halothiobacillus sp.]|uniref:response regulator transcription factor n=1 Tax=Halothiobacillus sp. TaxID=1891311 RepID=UPI002AD51EB8|nr:response regulator transcription factor [Halothiobacillus sp.]MDA3875746.1 response regulator transcription factor [Halothiobacillus sp.]
MIVDDHTMVRKALAHLIGSEQDIVVTAEADSGESALAQLKTEHVDVVLCDIHMPGMGGLEAIRRIQARYPDVGLIAVTAEADAALARSVLEAGVHGYVTKDAPPHELITAIDHARHKTRFISARIAQEIALQSMRKNTDPFDALSSREQQVLMMILEGKSNQFISDALCVSPKTVSTYKVRLQEKLGVSNDIELLRLAVKTGRIVFSE